MSSAQLKGLLIKNFYLFKKQKGSIICQILTPILCLFFVWLIQYIISRFIKSSTLPLDMKFPFIFNLPLYQRTKQSKLGLQALNCDEWYLFDFTDDISNEDKEFFGFNSGSSIDNNKIHKAKSAGMLLSQDGILQKYCKSSELLVPYFKKAELVNKKDNTNVIDRMNKEYSERLKSIKYLPRESRYLEFGFAISPDGTLVISEANLKRFKYRLQINENITTFSKTNGVSSWFVPQGINGKNFLKISVNAYLWLINLMNKAYIKKHIPNLNIISSYQFFPIKIFSNGIVQQIINIAGASFYPLAISLLMPLFMYSIIIEKESKLIEIMKINGMKMRNYWLSFLIFNYLVYLLTFSLYFLAGRFIFQFSIFVETNLLLQLIIFVGWGFCQIGLAFFFQVFLSNPRSSTSKK